MEEIRKKFPFFQYNKDIVYLDNANTSQIYGPCLSQINKIYCETNYNIGRSGYEGARKAQTLKEDSQKIFADFIGALPEQIIFTTGATEGLNLIAYSLCKKAIEQNRKLTILTTELEHASALMPWMAFGQNNIQLHYLKLQDDFSLPDADEIKATIEKIKPDILLLSSMTNTTGEYRNIKEIGEIAQTHNVLFIVDHAQGAAHLQIDVRECHIDYLAFSTHKMYGPKGVGILYAKNPDTIVPIKYGGGMNKFYEYDGNYELADGLSRMYAGTENVPNIRAAAECVNFLKSQWTSISSKEIYLGLFAYQLLSKLPGVTIYSKNTSPIILFKIEGYESSDIMDFLSEKNIYIRAGNHCAKLTKSLFGLSTCRVSIGIYNTEDDIYKLYSSLKEMLK